jgi:hypothetical protein
MCRFFIFPFKRVAGLGFRVLAQLVEKHIVRVGEGLVPC